jgi:hypothetical protein
VNVDDLLAREQIRDVIKMLARGTDRLDAELISSCYHPTTGSLAAAQDTCAAGARSPASGLRSFDRCDRRVRRTIAVSPALVSGDFANRMLAAIR